MRYTFWAIGRHLPTSNTGSSTHTLLLFEAEFLKNPGAHDSHLGWVVAVPLTMVYLPGGHLACAVHASGLLPLGDGSDLKNPGAHVSHLGWELLMASMYFPRGHPMSLATVQESVWVLLVDVEALKNPNAHDSHLGWLVAEPATLVYLPGGHLVWAVHCSLGQSVGQNENMIQKI